MILVEADPGEEWDSRTDWAAVAERAVRAAVEASDRGTLVGSALAVEISVKFTSDDEIQALNAAYRNKDKATNVLSFPMIEAEFLDSMAGADGGELLLGDIALAHGVCVSEAQEKGIEVAAHATHLVVHGTLHLLGYDHETGEEDAERMEEVERKALAGLGIADPYATTEVQSQLDA